MKIQSRLPIFPYMPVRILLADDHTLFREMLRAVLSRQGVAYCVVGEAENGPETLTLVRRHAPDLLLLDYKMPGVSRLSAFCRQVAHRSHTTRILIVSACAEEEVVLEAIIGGAQGYILKDASVAEILSAIATIQRGEPWVDPRLPASVFQAFQRGERPGSLSKLSRQELTILSLVAQGMSNKEISRCLHLSPKTTKNHLTHIFAKLGVEGRQQAARYFSSRLMRASDKTY